MHSALELETLIQPARFSALVLRTWRNIERSRALVAAADVAIRVGRQLCRPRVRGGTDGPSPSTVHGARVLRTWTKLKSGVLPAGDAHRRWVGAGRGERCDGCGDAIGPVDTAIELDFRDALLLQFHAVCFKAWEKFGGQRR